MTEEKAAAHETLGTFIKLQKCPRQKPIMNAKKDKRLNRRSWKNIKYFVKNQIDTKDVCLEIDFC